MNNISNKITGSLCLFLLICFAGLISGFYYYGVCVGKKSVAVVADTITVRDSCYFYLPSPIREVIKEVPAVVDTQAILNDYYTQRVYADTLIKTEFVTFYLRDTLFNNKILGREFEYMLSLPVPTPAKKKNSLGIFSGYSRGSTSIMAGYRYNRITYGLGYDFYNHSPMVGIGIILAEW